MQVFMRFCTRHLSRYLLVRALMAGRLIQDHCTELQMMSLPRNFNNKMRVMGQSLVKMEKALYNMHVRGAEYPKERLLDLIAEDDS